MKDVVLKKIEGSSVKYFQLIEKIDEPTTGISERQNYLQTFEAWRLLQFLSDISRERGSIVLGHMRTHVSMSNIITSTVIDTLNRALSTSTSSIAPPPALQ